MNAKTKKSLQRQIVKWYNENLSWKEFVEEAESASYGDYNLESVVDLFDKEPEDGSRFLLLGVVVLASNSFGSGCSEEVVATHGLTLVKSMSFTSGIVRVNVYTCNADERYVVTVQAEDGFSLYRI